MSTTTEKKTPKSKTKEKVSILRSHLADAREIRQIAEDILMDNADCEFPHFDADELLILRTAGIEGRFISREVNRLATVKKKLAECCTNSEYKKLRAASESAITKLNTEGPKIRQQIQRLEGELVALEESATNAEADYHAESRKRDMLRGLIPEWMKDESQSAEAIVRSAYRDLGGMQAEINGLRQMQSWDNRCPHAVAHMEKLGLASLVKSKTRRYVMGEETEYWVEPADWETAKAKARELEVKLTEELREKQASMEAELEQVRKEYGGTEFYVNQIPD